MKRRGKKSSRGRGKTTERGWGDAKWGGEMRDGGRRGVTQRERELHRAKVEEDVKTTTKKTGQNQ